MIRIENDIFYMSAGEACYIFRIDRGVPTHVYFGKRVEQEDDLAALGLGADGVPELGEVTAVVDGKQTALNFVYESADVSEQKYVCGPTLDGGKTLCVVLNDKKAKLKARMYYTPYARGGFSRRVVIENYGAKQVDITCVRQTVACSGDCDVVNLTADEKNGNNGGVAMGFFAAAASVGHGDNNGDAYGFLCAFADGNVEVRRGKSVTAESSCDAFTVGKGGEIACPEMLCVYSDAGTGGMSRVFHDILRESMGDNSLSERSPAVLFLPRVEDGDAVAAIKAAYEMGFGIVTVDGGEYSSDMIKALAGACAEEGIALGLRVRSGAVEKGSALFGSACKKSKSTSAYKYDFSDGSIDGLLQAVQTVTRQNDIHYVMIDVSETDMRSRVARGLFALRSGLTAELSELRVDYGIESDELRRALSLCYPLGCLRSMISPEPPESFKQRFDRATLGTLGYELNPLTVSDGIKRAVRAQKLSYQDDALTVLRGDIYRTDRDATCRMAVTKDKSRAYMVCDVNGSARVRFVGLDEHNLYHVHELDKTFSGAALAHCGIALSADGEQTYVFHLRQVADYYN